MSLPKGWAFSRRFLACAVTVLALFHLLPAEALLRPLLETLARLVGGLARAAGVDATVRGPQVLVPGTFGIEIAVECSGVPELALFLCAVAAFATSARSKGVGVLVAVGGVLAGNVLRLTALFWIGVHRPDAFEPIHAYLQGPASYVAMTLLWLGWLRVSAIPGAAKGLARPRGPAPGGMRRLVLASRRFAAINPAGGTSVNPES